MKCRFCGAEIGSEVCCHRCGRQVGDKPIERLITPEKPRTKALSSKKEQTEERSLLFPLILFVCSLAALCLCVFYFSDTFLRFFTFMANELSYKSLCIPAAVIFAVAAGISLIKVLKRL